MVHHPTSVLSAFGSILRARSEAITQEALPKRWVELLHYLDEQERRASRPPSSAESRLEAPRKDRSPGV